MIYTMGHCYPYTDIDSMVGSIVLAEILKSEGEDAKAVVLENTGLRDTTIAIFNETGLEIPANISKKELLGKDVKIGLVDHNNPYESFGRLGVDKEIYICVDHHYIEDSFNFKTLIYKKIGAATTILGQIIKFRRMRISDKLARAIVYAIVSDTMGLQSIKTSNDDVEMVDFFYENYKINTPLEMIIHDVFEQVDMLNMSIERILTNSLKEYLNGEIGIARIVVLTDSYRERIREILEEGWKTNYDLYVFSIYKQYEGITDVYFFDKKYGIFPQVLSFNKSISRSQVLLPFILNKISGNEKNKIRNY